MIKLPIELYKKIEAAALNGRPEEICGLIGGLTDGGDKIIKEVYQLENIDHSNEHFSMNPKDQLAAVKDMREKGYVPLGNFHSHPESPSRPSEEDKRLAYDRTASYMIISVMDENNPVLNSFHIDGDNVTKEELIIEEAV
ncbi:MAG: M67 family metallopeptidase [Clostridia bacterium]|nr:M67 family metallopeptidase [Clostridia bacterium]